MPLPLSDKYQSRTVSTNTAAAGEGLLLAANPDRVMVTISNASTAKVIRLYFRGLNGPDVSQFCPIEGQLTYYWLVHGPMAQAEIGWVGNGFVQAVTVYEMSYKG